MSDEPTKSDAAEYLRQKFRDMSVDTRSALRTILSGMAEDPALRTERAIRLMLGALSDDGV